MGVKGKLIFESPTDGSERVIEFGPETSVIVNCELISSVMGGREFYSFEEPSDGTHHRVGTSVRSAADCFRQAMNEAPDGSEIVVGPFSVLASGMSSDLPSH